MKNAGSPEEEKNGRGGKRSQASFFLVLTDLDGTLLDHDTYVWEPAAQALQFCREGGVPVVLVSSKTRAEILPIRREIGVTAPFVSENGGGIFFEKDTFKGLEPLPGTRSEGDLWKHSLGTPYRDLVRQLNAIREEVGCTLRGFSDMSIREISKWTGLDLERSALAADREFDEPFVMEGSAGQEETVMGAARARGLTISRGGRFYHLTGDNDKGRAVAVVQAWYGRLHREVISIALGDSPNDFPMLKRADYPVLVRSRRTYPELTRSIPRMQRTEATGPRGWNQAVMEILGRKEA